MYSGRELAFLNASVCTQQCSAMNGRTNPNVPWMVRLGWLRHPDHILNQMHLEILILGQQNKKGIMCNRYEKNISAFWRLKSQT